MKTKILPINSFCVGTWNEGRVEVGNCTVKDCCLDHHVEANIERLDTPCITKQVQERERFFLALSHWSGLRVQVHQSIHIGHLEGKTLILDKQLSGDNPRFDTGAPLLIYSVIPTDHSFLQDHPCCILTADGMLTLEKDTFIGLKDGHIDTLTPDELLEQLSRGKADRSPHWKQVQLSPLTKRPSKPTKGTMIYNEISKGLEFFDGKTWRKVKLEE